MTEIKAQLNYFRTSPRKVRLVADLVRGLDVSSAETQLEFSSKAASRPLRKLLNSAVANATNDFGLQKDNLYIKTIQVDSGSTLKRWMPKAFGRATPIRKRSSRILLILGTKKATPILRRKTEAIKPEIVSENKTLKAATIKQEAIKRISGAKTAKKPGIIRRIFQRKAI